MADGGDLCEAHADNLCPSDDGKLATARSRTATLPPRFNEAPHSARTFVFLAASLLMEEKLQPSSLSL